MFLGKVENYNISILNIGVNICDIKYLAASIKYSTRLGLLDTEQECERERLCLRVLDQMWTSTVWMHYYRHYGPTFIYANVRELRCTYSLIQYCTHTLIKCMPLQFRGKTGESKKHLLQ